MAIDWNKFDERVKAERARLNNEYAKMQTLPKASEAQPKAAEPKIPVLSDAFDQNENYIDKFKQGNIGGGVANFLGTGLTAAQSYYLNALNNVDSLTQGKGLQPFQYQMQFGDYEKAVADRRGVAPLSEQIQNPVLKTAYRLGMEIATDPIELTPIGFLNDIKLAKGTAQTSQAYASALQAGRMAPTGTTAVLPKANIQVTRPTYSVNNQPVPNLMAQRLNNQPLLLTEGQNWQAPNQPDFYVGRSGVASADLGNEVLGLPAPARMMNPITKPLTQTINAGEISKNELAKLRELMGREGHFGVRGLPKEDTLKKYRPNQSMAKSYSHYDDEIERQLQGTSAVSISNLMDDAELTSAIKSAQKYSSDGRVVIVKGDTAFSGMDEGEVVLGNVYGWDYRGAKYVGDLVYNSDQTKKIAFRGTPQRLQQQQQLPRANRETPFTVTRGEMSESYAPMAGQPIGQVQTLPRASGVTVQRGNTELGATLPRVNVKQRPLAQTGTTAKAEGLFVDYYPERRATDVIRSSDYVPFAQEAGINSEELITIYRGAPSSQKSINNGDWVTTSEQLAKDYAGNGKVIKSTVPAKHLYAPQGEGIEELIYSTNQRANIGTGRPRTLPKASEQIQNARSGQWSVGSDTARPEKTIDELVKEHGAIPKGEPPRAREIDIPKKTNYGDVQQHARTLQESTIVDDTLFKDINEAITQGSFTKPTKSNKTAVENASATLEQSGLDGAMNKFRSVLSADKTPTSEDIALGNRVLQELQKEGRYGDALDVAIDLSQMLSETGRTLQAARIAKRLSPEGRLMHATRIADKISKKTGKKVTLSDETIEQISNAKTEDEIVKANQKAAVEMWNQTPANWIDKINSWRYMAMLTNPKTHIRNIVGNSLFVPAREFKNLIGAGLERAMLPKAGERTKAILNPVKDKTILDFARKDFDNVKSILKNEGKLDDNVRKLEAKVFDTEALEAIRKLNMNALDAEDTWFMKLAYDSSLAQYMKANKIIPEKMVGETLEKGRAYAMNEALKATYRDANSLSRLISRGKAVGASGEKGVLGRVGGLILEAAIPFSKTPLNLIKRGIGYSPANIIRGIVNLNRVKSGKVTATEAIDQLASGLSGTAILGLGMYLGYNGIVSGKEGDYKDKLYNYNQMLGSQNYSLNIGGTSYTLDWAAPLSMPFFVGVELAKAVKDNNADLAAVLDAMTQISDPMVNLSMLKGINDIMTNNFEGLGQTAFDIGTGYAGQFNPTLFGQIARTADTTRRSTISTAETGTMRGIEKFGRKQLAKLPVASKQLEPYVDLWGREQKSGNFAENFLSPGYFKSENITPVDRELQSLMKGMDEETIKKILPTSTAYQYTIQSAGLPYRMTEKESTAYQKTRGQESYKGLEKLFKSVEYRKMTQEEKADAVQDIYSAAHQKAKYEYFDNKGLPVTLALDKEYQEKFRGLKGQITDKRFYSAVTDMKGKSRDIEKVFAAEQRGKVSDKFYEAFKISEESVKKARALKSSGLTADQYTKAMDGVKDMESDTLSNGKTIENSLSKKKKAYIDSAFPNVSDEQLKLLYELAGVSKTIGRYRPRFD